MTKRSKVKVKADSVKVAAQPVAHRSDLHEQIRGRNRRFADSRKKREGNRRWQELNSY